MHYCSNNVQNISSLFYQPYTYALWIYLTVAIEHYANILIVWRIMHKHVHFLLSCDGHFVGQKQCYILPIYHRIMQRCKTFKGGRFEGVYNTLLNKFWKKSVTFHQYLFHFSTHCLQVTIALDIELLSKHQFFPQTFFYFSIWHYSMT